MIRYIALRDDDYEGYWCDDCVPSFATSEEAEAWGCAEYSTLPRSVFVVRVEVPSLGRIVHGDVL